MDNFSPCLLDPDYFKVPDPHGLGEAFLRQIYQYVHDKNFSYLCTFTGRHRVGKSLSACAFSYLLDSTFWDNFEDRVCYTPEQFMRAVENIRKKKIIGGAIVLDEANIGIPSREWYNISNKSINYAIQAFGYLRPIVSFVCQDITYIDSQPRKLFHAFFEVQRTNNRYSEILPFNIQINKRTGKMYFVYPRFAGTHHSGRGAKIIMSRLKLAMPPDWFNERYEKHSQIMKDNLIEQMNDIIQSMTFKEKQGRQKDKYKQNEATIIKELLEEKENPIFITRGGTFRFETVARHFSIPHSYAKVVALKADAELKKAEKNESIKKD